MDEDLDHGHIGGILKWDPPADLGPLEKMVGSFQPLSLGDWERPSPKFNSYIAGQILTLPETNISPENRGPLEQEIPSLETIIFRGELLVSGSVMYDVCTYIYSPPQTTPNLIK